MVITGTHHGLALYIFRLFATLGYELFYFTASSITNINQGMASLAVALKSKNTDTRTTAISRATTALTAGVSEPALFGINLKYKTPLYACMIGSFFGAAIARFGKAVAYTLWRRNILL